MFNHCLPLIGLVKTIVTSVVAIVSQKVSEHHDPIFTKA